MSLKLLIDEDSQAKLLVNWLKQVGHDVVTINEVGFMGKVDSEVLDYARQENRVLLTHNCRDFEDLHQQDPNHSGILAVYRDLNPSNDMNFKAIVKAIANLEAATLDLNNQFVALNHWNY